MQRCSPALQWYITLNDWENLNSISTENTNHRQAELSSKSTYLKSVFETGGM